ncbi:MAG: hypothetical protein NC489_38175 [Ruminococcus flavefaciens]|nr:hypothetical protein [Ruminococcus flavefaciens]
MNTSTYKKAQSLPSMIPLGIAMDYQVKWNMHRIIRDFIQNFYDSIGYGQFADEFQYEWNVEGNMLHITMRTKGHSFSYEWLACLGGSTKTGKAGYAGEYGEGFKIAMLCLMKLGGDAVMSSGSWELHPCEYAEKIDGERIRMFGYKMMERKDDGCTTLELSGISASEDNIRYAEEAMLEFFYPQNGLLAEKIEEGDGYALYARSDTRIPCTESDDIPGVFYYKYIARGRLPFSAVIHLTKKEHNFDHDRSRNILSEATVAGAVYEMAEKLSPEASYWLLGKMERQWQDLPVFRRNQYADLNTWYYVICQLIRNICSDNVWIKKFAQEYPLENYAYIERLGSDNAKNRLYREARRWFEQKGRNGKRCRLLNPAFRSLGVSSIFQEYMEEKDKRYREPDAGEAERGELITACAGSIFPILDCEGHMPEIVVRTESRNGGGYPHYGILPCAETMTRQTFSKNDKKFHMKYRVEKVVMDEEDLTAAAEFQKVLLKYMGACMNMYGAERSARSNGMLTELGAILYRARDRVKVYEEKWDKT